jgi:hypothetical protein
MKTTLIHLKGGHKIETPHSYLPIKALMDEARASGATGVEIESAEHGMICFRLSDFLGMETWID